MRRIDFCSALREATYQEMERDPGVFIYGIGVPSNDRIFGSTVGLAEKFGPDRCFDTPLSEDAMTGFGLGAAINGMRPIHVHIRIDFLILAINQLVNMVSTYSYSTLGQGKVPWSFGPWSAVDRARVTSTVRAFIPPLRTSRA